jgi:UDP-glucuronate 4-epimerase
MSLRPPSSSRNRAAPAPPRVVVASSSSVYGNASRVPFTEDDPVNEPVSPYAATKRANELQCHTHWHLTKMPTACLRFFTVYGPRQRPDLAISTFLGKISRREDISVFGDGSSSRDYTYIDDIVSGVVASYERIDQHGYRVWNLGGSAPVRLDEMLATISRVVGHEPKITRLPMQPGDVLRTWADLSRSSRELGYSPTTGFEDGVRKQWEWMRKS